MEKERSRIEGVVETVGVRGIFPAGIAFLCGVFMLCIIPLYVHDGFFDINRAKIQLLETSAPWLAAAMGLMILQVPRKDLAYDGFPWRMLLPMILFLIGCVCSCAMRGFEEAVLTGSEGRYGGLYFVLSMTAMFVIIALGCSRGTLIAGICIATGTIIAALGCLNALGLDPLNFYAGMRASQIPAFLSTIGHYDFYGTYLLLPAALGYAAAVKGKSLAVRIPAAIGSIIMTMGVYAARTDSAWMGMILIAYALFFLSGEDLSYMSRSLLMTAVMVLLFPVVVHMITFYSSHEIQFDGAYLWFTFPRALLAAAVILLLAFILLMMKRHSMRGPGYRTLARIGLILFLVVFIAFIGLMVYSTLNPQEDTLFGYGKLFRLDDNFGSRRGYIWTRVWRAFLDGEPLQKLFGQGVELTKRLTRPYIENAAEEQLSGGVYNDAHSQPLQILLTMGIFGACAFLANYVVLLFSFRKEGEEDPLLSGLAVAMSVYFVVMLINVTQPILIMEYLSLGALGISTIGSKRRQILEESGQ